MIKSLSWLCFSEFFFVFLQTETENIKTMAKKNYYEILGITADEKKLSEKDFEKVLKQKYRKICLKYHPDKNPGNKDAETKFKEAVEAYDVLSDKNKRHQYDTFGTVDGNAFQGGGMNMEDIMREFMRHHAGFSSFFDDDNDFDGSFRRTTINRGTDKKVRVTLTLEEAYNRGKKTIKYDRLKPCSTCGGKGSKDGGSVGMCQHCHGTGVIIQRQTFAYGFSQQTAPCPYCHGTGKMISNPCSKCSGNGLEVQEETLTIDIPAGVTDGAVVRIPKKGNYCERLEGQEGDLILYFKISEDSKFKIIPNSPYDLAYIDETPVLDCITGCDKTIKHIDGKTYKYVLRQGIEDGSVINLAGKGLAKSNGLYGDLKIVVKYKMPVTISLEDSKLIDKLKKSKNFS